jgi:diphthamide biosynthesis enzyme Dph1/Dph2-like protein
MAKTLFIEFRKKFDNEIDFSQLDNIISEKKPKSISLAATIQYLNLIPNVKQHLTKKNIKVIIKKGSIYNGQVLGCNSQAFDKKADLLFLLCDGKFHAFNNAIQLEREIYVFNTYNIEKVSLEEISREKTKIQGKISKFISSEKVGLLISNKSGQNFKSLRNLIKKLEKKNKIVYLFESDNINPQELENFNLSIYINTACYGLSLDSSKIVNLRELLRFL